MEKLPCAGRDLLAVGPALCPQREFFRKVMRGGRVKGGDRIVTIVHEEG